MQDPALAARLRREGPVFAGSWSSLACSASMPAGMAFGLTISRNAKSSNEKTSTFSFVFLPSRMTLRK